MLPDHSANDCRLRADWMRPHGCQAQFRLFLWHEDCQLALIGNEEGIESQHFTRRQHRRLYGHTRFIKLDPYLRGLGQLIQDRGQAAASQVSQAVY